MTKQPPARERLRAQLAAEAKAARLRRIVGLGSAAVAVILAVVLAVAGFNSLSAKQAAWYPANATETKDGVVLYGGKAKAGAPTIDVYLDFQCPVCRALEERYAATLAELARAGEIKVVQHTFTFMDGHLFNTASSRAANAASCADTHGGKYAELTAAIFANQAPEEVQGSVGYADTLLRATLPAQVGIAGADLTAFQACYDAKQPAAFHAELAEYAYKNHQIAGQSPVVTRDGVRLPVNAIATKAYPATTVEEFKSMVLTGR